MKSEESTGFSILLASSSGLTERQIREMLLALRFRADIRYAQPAQLKALINEQIYDVVILGEDDFDLSTDLVEKNQSAVLLLMKDAADCNLLSACISRGIFAAAADQIPLVFPALLSSSVRIRAMRIRTDSLQRRLSDTKLVNRAKLLLMSRLQMSESQAHRYIEKAAMDSGESRREVAMGIIRAYEE